MLKSFIDNNFYSDNKLSLYTLINAVIIKIFFKNFFAIILNYIVI